MECPPLHEIERLLAGDPASTGAGVDAHVRDCAPCRSRADSVRRDLALSERLRSAHADLPAPGAGGWRLPEGYDFQEEIGRGGQGIVVKARQRGTGRVVAIKLLRLGRDASGDGSRRFERETEVAAALRHPNVVTVFEGGTFEGWRYFVMEFVAGRPLREHARALTTIEARLRLFLGICRGVHHAHQRGVIHRDLKPENVLVDAAGEPRVIDFGLARPVLQGAGDTLTADGAFVGTLRYAAPERVAEDADTADVRSDVYSLGLILGELATGRSPFADARNLGDLVAAIAAGAPAIDGLDGDVASIVARATHRDPDRRYASAAGLADDVERRLRGDAVEARRDESWYALKKTLRRYRAPIAAAAVVFAVLAGATGVAARSWLHAERANARADRVRGYIERILDAADPLQPDPEPTMKDALDAAARWIAVELGEEREIQATMREVLARAYEGLGLYAEAEVQARAAIALRREIGDERSVEFARDLNLLGLVRHRVGAFDEAEGFYVQALDLRRALFGEAGPEVAQSRLNLGCLHLSRGDRDRAQVELEAAVRLLRTCDPVPVEDLGTALQRLADIHANRQDRAAAEACLAEALALFEREFGPDHPLVADLLDESGRTYALFGRLDEAEDLIRRAIAIYGKSAVGADHHHLALIRFNLATLLLQRRCFDEAEDELLGCLDVDARRVGWGGPDVTKVLNELAVAFRALGRPQDAESLLRDVLGRYVAVYGEESTLVATCRNDLAMALADCGRFDEALAQSELSRRVYFACNGACHPFTTQSCINVGVVEYRMGRYAEALADLEEVAPKLDDPDAPPSQRITCLDWMIAALRKVGRDDEAVRRFPELIAMLEAASPRNDRTVANALNHFAALLYETNRVARAIATSRRAIEFYDKAQGAAR